ncbi:hypothetical protein EC9_22800 [Rosistilla ulvae]|uniref:Uncharacterized protein n=2 Tax=Rosistilla ulvae TaxID=1930277 RepID=A0A517LZP4_9BACT|nr:hypothetical protein EC9_22800 [Rosistilla ulvae]
MKSMGKPMLSERDRASLKQAIQTTVLPEYVHKIGEVRMKWVADRAGIWVEIAGEDAYFGQTIEAAMMTAQECDWIFLSKHPPMLDDDWTWFDERVAHGESWQDRVVPMKRQESRERVATRYCPGE